MRSLEIAISLADTFRRADYIYRHFTGLLLKVLIVMLQNGDHDALLIGDSVITVVKCGTKVMCDVTCDAVVTKQRNAI